MSWDGGAKVIRAGDGEVVGDSPDRRVEILSDHPGVHSTWSRFAAGREGADLHVHYEHTDCFFVLEGKLEVRLGAGGAPHELEAGQLAMMPPRVVHGFRNVSDAEVRYLNFHIPGCGFADFMRGIRDGSPHPYDQFDPPADGGRGPADASIGAPRAPFALLEIGKGERLEPAPGALRSIYVLEGELSAGGDQAAAKGAWVQAEGSERIAAKSASAVLVLDVEGPEA